MNKKKISLVLVGLVVLVVVGGLVYTNKMAVSKQVALGNIKYETKQEVKAEEVKKEDINVEKNFEVKNVEKVEDKLILQTDMEIENADEAYKTALFLEDNIKSLNKEKIDSEGIKNVNVVIKGTKSWLYDGTSNIKEIVLK